MLNTLQTSINRPMKSLQKVLEQNFQQIRSSLPNILHGQLAIGSLNNKTDSIDHEVSELGNNALQTLSNICRLHDTVSSYSHKQKGQV